MKYNLDIKKFEAFVWYHLTHRMQHPIGDFHRELLSSFRHSRIAIAAPRGFAKSTWASFFYPLYMLLTNPGIKILLVSATNALAEHWLAEIRKELEVNKSLHDFYGDQEGSDKWTNEELNLTNGSVLLAKGSGKQIRGFRPHLIIGDDLETDEMVVSTDQRRKFDDWFWKTLMGTCEGDNTQVIVVGTVLHPESFLATLLKDGRSGWKSKLYKAADDALTKSLWEDMWPIEVLRQRKLEMGEYAFAQEYMNDPIPDDMRKFQKGWIQYYDDLPANCVYYTTVDPAIEIGAKNDSTAIVTCAVDHDENMYVVETINRKFLPAETVSEIFSVWKRWNSHLVAIESVGFQKLLKNEIDRQKKIRKEYPLIRDLESGGRRKPLRIEALQPRFSAGKIFIKKEMVELETQLLRFPSTQCHDDIIDALAYQLDIIHPAQKARTFVNPNSFIAILEGRRRNSAKGTPWGNHKLRDSL